MKQNLQYRRYIISGGGTGGHVFPAISIARALIKLEPEAEILFVGAENRMEMKKIPEAGFKIIGLPVSGFKRKLSFENVRVMINLVKSLLKARKIIKDFKPKVVIGTGGYASGPILQLAGKKGIPTLIQEQNSYPGITNKLLAKRASKICVAYKGMDKYFPKEKILFTGNPVREDIEGIGDKMNEALEYFKLQRAKKTLLILGGSLGARTINMAIMRKLEDIKEENIQIIWQSGKLYHDSAMREVDSIRPGNIRLYDFITRMDLAYFAADLVISRAGAGTISELCLCAKPSILVPSPNVAEDHQTHNARTLVKQNAAELISDSEAIEKLIPKALDLIKDDSALKILSQNIVKMAIRNSAGKIAEEVLKLVKD